MAVDVEVPALGESVTQAILISWHKADGQTVAVDEPLCELETDKANVDLPSPAAGVLRHAKEAGETVAVGEVIARIDVGQAPSVGQASSLSSPSTETGKMPVPPAENLSPAVRAMVQEHHLDPAGIRATGPGGRITKEDVINHLEQRKAAPAGEEESLPPPASSKPSPPPPATPTRAAPADTMDYGPDGIRRVAMSKIRKRIAERLVQAQQTAAILTTFNEIDMSAVLELRGKYRERFTEVYGVSLGLMSFFARGVVLALREYPRLNAEIDGDDVVYHNYVHLGIAVSTDRGLAVPVLRNLQGMSFARIETEIKRLATATREGKLSLEELSGGTFTITNGGVFGSLLSTPIVNPPQSGILGLHAIQKRAVVIDDQIVIRPMMYVALSYDHRLVDGRESVSFLVRLKQLLEDPARLMLEV